MNIKEVEKITGISSQNIRFYEKYELVQPVRNANNGYREYNAEDIRKLKIIKMLRMIDMPVEQIKLILHEKKDLNQSLEDQEYLLKQKLAETKYAIEVCKKIKKSSQTLNDINVDEYLENMSKEPSHFFKNWINDYKDVIQHEHERVFTFTPDTEITDRYSFANALYAYAMKENKELIITKEGMYPEFVMDGITYTAGRNYTRVAGIPVAVIRCTRKYSDEKEYKHGRKKWIRILRIFWPAILWMVFILVTRGSDLFSSKEGIIIIIAFLILSGVMSALNYFLYWNRDYSYEDKK